MRAARTITSKGLWAAWAFVLILAAGPVLLALAWALADGLSGREGSASASVGAIIRPFSPSTATLLASTLVWTLGMGLAAMALAWGPAWWLARRQPRLVWVVAPLLMPAYVAYTGWGQARAPGTWMGDLIERAATAGGWESLPVLVGRALAAGGLVLWVWPVAAVVLAAWVRRIDPGVLEQLALDTPPGLIGRARSLVTRLRLAAPGLLAACACAALVLMGSAVPLHLARVPTYSITLWLALDQAPSGSADHWRVWACAWPMLALAAAGAIALVRLTPARLAPTEHLEATASGRALRRGRWIVAALWALGVLVPATMLAFSVRGVSSIGAFWRLSGPEIESSARVALWTGLIVALGAPLMWSAARRAPGAARWALGAAVFVGLVPGVLVGSAVARTWALVARLPGLETIIDSPAILVAAHAARFAWIGLLAGWLLAASEDRAREDLRTLDGARGLRGWWTTARAGHTGTMLGVAAAAAALSLHEIEASIMVQPPGVRSLARQVLEYLHFWRLDELGAASVWLVGATAALGALAAWAWRRP
jgi:ABC-type Fe3+ transport system permease subunit